jgi:hypothetical protein
VKATLPTAAGWLATGAAISAVLQPAIANGIRLAQHQARSEVMLASCGAVLMVESSGESVVKIGKFANLRQEMSRRRKR